MKRFGLFVLAAPLLTGCAMFSNDKASMETAYVPAEPPQAARVVPPAPKPQLREASMGPTNIIPCEDGADMFTQCRRNADLHREQEITLMPATAIKAPQPTQDSVPVAAAGEE